MPHVYACLPPPPFPHCRLRWKPKGLYMMSRSVVDSLMLRLDPIPFSCATYCRVIAIKPEKESAHYRSCCYFYTLPEAGNGFRSFMGLYDVLISFIFSPLLARGIINVEQYWSFNKVSLDQTTVRWENWVIYGQTLTHTLPAYNISFISRKYRLRE